MKSRGIVIRLANRINHQQTPRTAAQRPCFRPRDGRSQSIHVSGPEPPELHKACARTRCVMLDGRSSIPHMRIRHTSASNCGKLKEVAQVSVRHRMVDAVRVGGRHREFAAAGLDPL